MIKHLLIIFRIFKRESVFNILFFNPFLIVIAAKSLNGANRNLLVEPHTLKYERPKRQRGRAKVCRIIGSCERQPKDMPKFSQTDGQTPHRQSVLVGGKRRGATGIPLPRPLPPPHHHSLQYTKMFRNLRIVMQHGGDQCH